MLRKMRSGKNHGFFFIQKITNRDDWIFSKRVCDMIVIGTAIEKVIPMRQNTTL